MNNASVNESTVCPVCESEDTGLFLNLNDRVYLRCHTCRTTFIHPSQLPSAEIELREYALHENNPCDAGYKQFLSRVAAPLLARLQTPQSGLDYGCGPGPALATMLREAGHEVALYDPFFRPDVNALTRRYDFITCTEVVEHFHHPYREFGRLNDLLKPGGWLAVMTCFQTEDERFAGWHYRRDPTHVVFYREETFRHIARRQGWTCEFPGRDVVLMRKAR